LVVVSGSFYVKRWIGQKRWRSIHFASFGVFVASLIHGIWAGTDTDSPLMLGLYLGAAVVVFGLIGHRITEDTAGRDQPIKRGAGLAPRVSDPAEPATPARQ
jgi:DMSO/TMAO reductase YedYZ heme-binding membrane subunit